VDSRRCWSFRRRRCAELALAFLSSLSPSSIPFLSPIILAVLLFVQSSSLLSRSNTVEQLDVYPPSSFLPLPSSFPLDVANKQTLSFSPQNRRSFLPRRRCCAKLSVEPDRFDLRRFSFPPSHPSPPLLSLHRHLTSPLRPSLSPRRRPFALLSQLTDRRSTKGRPLSSQLPSFSDDPPSPFSSSSLTVYTRSPPCTTDILPAFPPLPRRLTLPALLPAAAASEGLPLSPPTSVRSRSKGSSHLTPSTERFNEPTHRRRTTPVTSRRRQCQTTTLSPPLPSPAPSTTLLSTFRLPTTLSSSAERRTSRKS
jgi:hypothetical protein